MSLPDHTLLGLTDKPVFAEPWQAQVFALTLALHARGAFSWSEWTQALSAELQRHPDSDASQYYEHWLRALEGLLCARGLVERGALFERKQAWAEAHRSTPHGAPVLEPNFSDR